MSTAHSHVKFTQGPQDLEGVAMQGRTSMLLCAKALFLTSAQLERLRRGEQALLASHSFIKSSDTSEFARLLAYVERPGKCSAREALSLLRSFSP